MVHQLPPPFWFPIAVAGGWLALSAMLAELSGWTKLAAQYRTHVRPEGTPVRGQVMGIGGTGQNRVTTLIPTNAGLYMERDLLLRFRQPALFIPWSAITYAGEQRLPRSHKHAHVYVLGGITTLRLRDAGYAALRPFQPSATP